MLKKIFPAIIFLVFIFKASAADSSLLNKFFTDKDIARAAGGEIITRMYIKNDAVGENTDLSIKIPATEFINQDFSSYEMITDEKAFIPYKMDNKEEKLKFYNALSAYSKLSGMKYFSRRIQKIETLILSCFRIEAKYKIKPLKDIVYNEINEKVSGFFLQKDNRFGSLTYQSELFSSGNNFILLNKCIDPITKFVVTVADKNEFILLSYFIYDEKAKGFFYYSANVMRIRSQFVLKKNDIMTLYPTTFSNRLRAATVHFVKLIGLNWDDRINPWDEDKLQNGFYKNY